MNTNFFRYIPLTFVLFGAAMIVGTLSVCADDTDSFTDIATDDSKITDQQKDNEQGTATDTGSDTTETISEDNSQANSQSNETNAEVIERQIEANNNAAAVMEKTGKFLDKKLRMVPVLINGEPITLVDNQPDLK